LPLLDIRGLRTQFFLREGILKAVDGVSFGVENEETVCLVGESGCGKSVLSLCVLRLIQEPPGKIVSGQIFLDGLDLLKLPTDQMRKFRGKELGMIFQDPMTSLNPVLTVGFQISEVFRLHQNLDRTEAWNRAIEMLKVVGIPSPEKRVGEYPHQLSGGMRQRAMIAMALSCHPKLLIADEPTTALDVTIQAQVLDLMIKIKKESRTSILLITHDLGVVAEMADRVIVMYAGKVVESAPVRPLFRDPLHPYTQGLLASIPRVDQAKSKGKARESLREITGVVPNLINLPQGCAFAPRCPQSKTICREQDPPSKAMADNRTVRCWLFHE